MRCAPRLKNYITSKGELSMERQLAQKEELKVYRDPKEGPCRREFYEKSEVDKALAELKAKLENVQARAYAESVGAWIMERRLRRALWLARAERAKDRAMMCDDFAYLGDTECDINMTLARTWMKCRLLKSSEWSKVWQEVERKCRAMAERFKD